LLSCSKRPRADVGWDGKWPDKQLIGAVARVAECRAVSLASWKIRLAPMIGTVVISEVDALTYLVLSEVE
jgi:hypothetical protein